MAFKEAKPDIISLSSADLEGVKSRISLSPQLSESDKKIIFSIFSMYQWMYGQLETARLSMHRLRKIFGFSTEKQKKLSPENDTINLKPTTPEPPANTPETPEKKQ